MISGPSAFLLMFLPIFIAVDAVGNIPFFITLTDGMNRTERNKTAHIAVGTAAVLGLAFLFFGTLILDVMGISVGSFAIGGGIVLLVLSVRYIITGHIVDLIKEEMVAVVPIGTPLTVGPAVITTLSNLTSLYSLELSGNQISDISALVENSGLDSPAFVSLVNNNLDLGWRSEDMDNIRALKDRGVGVRY